MEEGYREYASWWVGRGLNPPPMPKLGLFVAHPKYGLIAGACVFDTDGGPLLLLEHFSVNPKNMVLWKSAAVFMLTKFRQEAKRLGKWPVVLVDRKSLAKVCAEQNFVYSGARVMVAPLRGT